MSNSLPLQWFNDRLGPANGLVKLGGGIGATVMALVVQQLIDKVGIAWTFRVTALTSLTTGFIGIFALCVTFFFLPTVATSIGLSSATAAAVMACYNACMAVGRLASGIACDKLGSTNMLLPWLSTPSLCWRSGPAFFVTMPTAIGRLLGPHAAPAGISMAITGWSVGDLLGNPIAGFLIAATHADRASSIGPYRAAILYAGGAAAVSTALVLVARLKMDANLIKKL
ncbi:major facilitator superfamily domain-containing protein [Aspergillus pseudotamarii]|uniref:Major facilitator superfamily domain-containing protein n=1 Tax=Aspergillus pseudotamarii TaxID=132259 RepID=A0A5N6SPF7_ASPPS|nr:major facilitator superfamily domain-containing protein [Aspergillus pseudotamarii]KAE8136465.1 major facilitator superfamily domain-containing protein [Aspergillus pseudotamarii]